MRSVCLFVVWVFAPPRAAAAAAAEVSACPCAAPEVRPATLPTDVVCQLRIQFGHESGRNPILSYCTIQSESGRTPIFTIRVCPTRNQRTNYCTRGVGIHRSGLIRILRMFLQHEYVLSTVYRMVPKNGGGGGQFLKAQPHARRGHASQGDRERERGSERTTERDTQRQTEREQQREGE